MLNLIDGPCQGDYMVRRAPVFLRAVLENNGGKDVLDQLTDTPKDTETVYVYKLIGGSGWIHFHGKGLSGFYATGCYKYLSEVNGQELRDNLKWGIWAASEFANLPQDEKEGKVQCPIDLKICDKVFKACCSCERNIKK